MTIDDFKKQAKQVAVFAFVAILIFWFSYLWGAGGDETQAVTQVKAFTLILWSILLEAMPFVLLGTILSSLIQIFVSQETILKVLPNNNILRLIFAAAIGFVFPICECAIVPVTRGLIKKGMPVGAAIAFMIAAPILNPVVLFSTYNAFPSMPQMVFYRAVFGFSGAVIIGLIAGKLGKHVLSDSETVPACGCESSEGCHIGHGHEHEEHRGHDAAASRKEKIFGTIKQIIAHTNLEIKSVGGYLIFGALIAAFMQMFVPKEMIVSLAQGRVSSIASMMSLAYILSLCSEADAFIASTFMLRFTAASVLAFLLTGPMIDIKNTFMFFGSFKKKFSIKLIAVILIVCFALALMASFLMGGANA